MSTTQPNGARKHAVSPPRVTTQTIAEIEAQAEAIRWAEETAMVDLAAWLRETAVTLPAESKLPIRFAKAAKTIEYYTGRRSDSPWLGFHDVHKTIEEYGREGCEVLFNGLAKILGREVS